MCPEKSFFDTKISSPSKVDALGFADALCRCQKNGFQDGVGHATMAQGGTRSKRILRPGEGDRPVRSVPIAPFVAMPGAPFVASCY